MSFQNEIWLALRNDGILGDGSPGNPYEVNTPTRFATVMRSIVANTLIRLLPGVFRTRGTYGNGYSMDPIADGWSPKPGQKIIGAGVFASTLQFVWDLAPSSNPLDTYAAGQRHSMIATPLA